MPMEARLTVWLNMLGPTDKIMEYTFLWFLLEMEAQLADRSTCWDSGIIYNSKMEYSCN